MQARYYDPRIGRFMSQDPVGFVASNPMSFNRYLYVNNNPYKYTDPDGKFLWGAVIGAGIELAAQIATGKEIDLTDIAVAGAVGLVTGGFAGRAATKAIQQAISAKKAVTQTAAVSSAASALGSMAQDVANENPISLKNAGISAVSGALGGYSGAKLGNYTAAQLNRMDKAGEIAAHISNTTKTALIGNDVRAATSTLTGTLNVGVDLVLSVADKETKDKLE